MDLPPILNVGVDQILTALQAVSSWQASQVESAAAGVLSFTGSAQGWTFLVVRWEPRHAGICGRDAERFCVDGTARKDSTIVRLSTAALREMAMEVTESYWRTRPKTSS